MTYLLDTNVAIAVIRNKPTVVRERFRDALATGASVAISTISTYELWYGVAKSTRQEEGTALLRTFLAGSLSIVPFTDDAARIAGRILSSLESQGTPIGPYDLLIAAQAMARQAILVTANGSEFARVEGLTWEDWASNLE